MKLFPKKGFEFTGHRFNVGLKVNKSTRIASVGSCFARRIREWLIANEYNYIKKEGGKKCYVDLFPGDKGTHKAAHGSAAWERVYHIHTFSQIANYSFDTDYDRIYPFMFQGREFYTDLLRTRMVYGDYRTAKEDIDDHIRQSRNVLKTADLLIFTLGLTEVWQYGDMVLGSLFRGIDIKKHFRATGYTENYQLLNEAIDKLKHYNKPLKVMITVSPVHLLATSRDMDCVTATCASKSILRAVADETTKRKDCYYFPSYEIANIMFPLMGKDAYPDNHHVGDEVVNHIMSAYERECT